MSNGDVLSCAKGCVPVTTDQSKWSRLASDPGHAVLANGADVQTVSLLVPNSGGVVSGAYTTEVAGFL
jgi:hypothetical protein